MSERAGGRAAPGFLSESTALPRRAVPIAGVGEAGLLGLHTAIYAAQSRSGSRKRPREAGEALGAANPGVAARAAGDAAASALIRRDWAAISSSLEQKALAYEWRHEGGEGGVRRAAARGGRGGAREEEEEEGGGGGARTDVQALLATAMAIGGRHEGPDLRVPLPLPQPALFLRTAPLPPHRLLAARHLLQGGGVQAYSASTVGEVVGEVGAVVDNAGIAAARAAAAWADLLPP